MPSGTFVWATTSTLDGPGFVIMQSHFNKKLSWLYKAAYFYMVWMWSCTACMCSQLPIVRTTFCLTFEFVQLYHSDVSLNHATSSMLLCALKKIKVAAYCGSNYNASIHLDSFLLLSSCHVSLKAFTTPAYYNYEQLITLPVQYFL